MRTLRFDIVSIFPGMFESPFGDSIIERACEKGLLDIRVHDLRDYTLNKHRKVDDTPFGGGVGMIMNVEPIDLALKAIKKEVPKARTILLSPSGSTLSQKKANELSWSYRKNVSDCWFRQQKEHCLVCSQNTSRRGCPGNFFRTQRKKKTRVGSNH